MVGQDDAAALNAVAQKLNVALTKLRLLEDKAMMALPTYTEEDDDDEDDDDDDDDDDQEDVPSKSNRVSYLAFIMFKKKMAPKCVLCLLLCVVGVVTVIFYWKSEHTTSHSTESQEFVLQTFTQSSNLRAHFHHYVAIIPEPYCYGPFYIHLYYTKR